MPVILNCLDDEQTTVMGGSHFTFKPMQLKYFSDSHIAKSIGRLRADDGFIELPEEFESLALLKPELFEQVITQEQRDIIAEKRKEGIDNYCRKLRSLIYNATISL